MDKINLLRLFLIFKIFVSAEWHKNTGSHICVIDYCYLNLIQFFPYYFKTISERLPYVAEVIAKFLIELKNLNIIVSYKKAKIVGFSLGGQLAGLAGRALIELVKESVDLVLGNSNFIRSTNYLYILKINSFSFGPIANWYLPKSASSC